MPDESEVLALLHENRRLRMELDELRKKVVVRIEPYTVKEFAEIVRRSPEYVSTRCRVGRIKALPGKPYLIPPVELMRYLKA